MDAVVGDSATEHCDLELRLDLRCPANGGEAADQRVFQEYQERVLAALAQVAGDHWEPDGPTDPETMWSAGRLEGRHDAGQLIFDSVTLPLKRPAIRSPDPVAMGYETTIAPGRATGLQRIHGACEQIALLAVVSGWMLTLWGMYTEWGLAGVAVGIIAAPAAYIVVPVIGLVKYGALFLVLSNFIVPGLCIAIAYSTNPEP